jgi:hypothetical protein
MAEAKEQPELLWAERLTQLLVPILRHQIERQGVRETGAGNYYNIRVKEDYIFRSYEIELARRILTSNLDIRRVDEVGSGFGQLVFLLGWNGLKAIGLESDGARARTANALRQILELVDPQLTKNIQLVEEEFPPANMPQPEPGAMVVTTNIAATRTVDQQLAVLKAMRRYTFVLSDIMRFFDPSRDPADTLALYARAGLQNPELFFDAGTFGRFYLFVNAD